MSTPDFGEELRRIMELRRQWLSARPDVVGDGNPPMTLVEYHMAEGDGEGNKLAYGLCRVCDREVVVPVLWGSDGAVYPMGSGRAPGCTHDKCGDKCPADFTRMVVSANYQRCEIAREIQDVCFSIGDAIHNQDATGEKMLRQKLAALRAGIAVVERAKRRAAH